MALSEAMYMIGFSSDSHLDSSDVVRTVTMQSYSTPKTLLWGRGFPLGVYYLLNDFLEKRVNQKSCEITRNSAWERHGSGTGAVFMRSPDHVSRLGCRSLGVRKWSGILFSGVVFDHPSLLVSLFCVWKRMSWKTQHGFHPEPSAQGRCEHGRLLSGTCAPSVGLAASTQTTYWKHPSWTCWVPNIEGGDQLECSPALQGPAVTLESESHWYCLLSLTSLSGPLPRGVNQYQERLFDTNALKSPDDLAIWLLNVCTSALRPLSEQKNKKHPF